MIESIRLMKNSICNGFRRRFTALSLLALAITGLSTGCAPYSTFPPDSDTGLKVYPWMAPSPEVMATSIRQTHARVSPDTPLIYNLPAGMTQTAWQYVQNKLGPDARAMVEGDKVFLDLKRFGVRNTKAFADIGVWNDGAGFLVTVSLNRDNVMPFRVMNLQRFYISMSEPVPNYPVSLDDEPIPSDDDAGTVDQAGGSK